MNLKEIFQPTIKKVILTIFLFWISSSYFSTGYISLFGQTAMCDPCGCYGKWGAPLSVREVTAIGASMTENTFYCGTRKDNFNTLFLISDLVFWYVLSGLAISSYNKFKLKKLKN